MAFINIQGQKFGHLTVIEKLPYDKTQKASQWKCLCDCGNYTTATGPALRAGDKKSCGCGKWAKPQIRYCEYCGKSMTRNRRFCSNTCRSLAECGADPMKASTCEVDQSFPWKAFGGKWVCRYQSFVCCTDRNCGRCGWNPEVAERRKQKYLQKRAEGTA